MSRRPLGHGEFRHMSQFKAVAADWEYFLSLSDEGNLYCLSDRQVYILLVQCEYIGWLTRWYNTADITQKTVELVQSEVMNSLMSCVDVSVLISQAELNLVDSTTNKAIESQALRDILEDRYDGTPTSINPNAPTVNFGSSGDRNEALCAGLMAFVYQFARAQADSVRAGQVGGLLAVAAIAALLIPGLNFFYIVGASIAVLLGLGTIGVTTEVAIAALTDTDALDLVVCHMRDTLDAQAVTQANWNACLNTYPFAPGSNAAIVADFIKSTLPDNYLTILNILGQAYTGVIDGDPLPACPCTPPDPACVEFLSGMNGWSINQDIGTYVAGQGFASELVSGNYYMYVQTSTVVSDNIYRVRLTYSTPVTHLQLSRTNGASPRVIPVGTPSTTITFDSTTIAGWTNLVGTGGLRIVSYNDSGMTVSTRLVEACVYKL